MLMLLAKRKAMAPKPFKPDYAPSPGLLLEVHLDSYDMSASEFARRCGRPVKFIEELVSGSAPLDRETARLIVKEFGGEAEAWLRMEEEYRQKLASDAEKRAGREAIWGRFLFFPRVLSRAYRSLARDRRSLPRQS